LLESKIVKFSVAVRTAIISYIAIESMSKRGWRMFDLRTYLSCEISVIGNMLDNVVPHFCPQLLSISLSAWRFLRFLLFCTGTCRFFFQ
jgi:hypothetical protein